LLRESALAASDPSFLAREAVGLSACVRRPRSSPTALDDQILWDQGETAALAGAFFHVSY
jgi:hypothetical protein